MFHVGNGLGFRRSGQCDLNRQKSRRGHPGEGD